MRWWLRPERARRGSSRWLTVVRRKSTVRRDDLPSMTPRARGLPRRSVGRLRGDRGMANNGRGLAGPCHIRSMRRTCAVCWAYDRVGSSQLAPGTRRWSQQRLWGVVAFEKRCALWLS
jgi:hypothetical protein